MVLFVLQWLSDVIAVALSKQQNKKPPRVETRWLLLLVVVVLKTHSLTPLASGDERSLSESAVF